MESTINTLGALFSITPIAIGLAICYYLLVVVPRKKREAFQQFATKLGLTYNPKGTVPYNGLLPGGISNVVQGTDHASGKDVAFFHLFYVSGSGKNRKEYRRTVMQVGIKNTNLHAYVNSKLNDLKEQINLASSQRFEAEGSFGKYFDLYFPEGNHIESLSLFAPDVLSVIMANYGMYDIEIKGNRLYVYDYHFIERPASMENFYNLGLALAKELDSNAPRRINLKGAAAATDGAVTALKSKILTPSVIATVGIFFVMFFLGPLSAIFDPNGKWEGARSYMMPVVMIAVVILVLVGVARNAKLQRDYQAERKHFQDKLKK